MSDYRTNWMPPASPLGAAIKRESFDGSEEAAQAYAVSHFAQVDYDFVRDRNGDIHHITEADCRQIKWAGVIETMSWPTTFVVLEASVMEGWDLLAEGSTFTTKVECA